MIRTRAHELQTAESISLHKENAMNAVQQNGPLFTAHINEKN